MIRTIEQERTRRILVPLAPKAFDEELLLYARWYDEYRPHRTLRGRTPNEVYSGILAARDGPRIEPRFALASMPNATDPVAPIAVDATKPRLVVTPFKGRQHLPIVSLEREA
jgi:hypothetical protein